MQPASPGPWHEGLTRHHWRIFAVTVLGWLFSVMAQRIFVLARGPALRDLLPAGTSAAGITWHSGAATAIFMTGWAAGGIVFGILGDRRGRARIMTLCMLMYAVFTGLSGLARGWWDFAALRFLAGLGVGGEFAACATLLAEALPDRARPHALGLLQVFSMLGNMAASALSYAILSWRWLFAAGFLPALLAIAIAGRIEEPGDWRKLQAAGPAVRRGSLADLFRIPRWRRATFAGLALAISGVVGLWGIGFWTPELIRDALRDAPPEIRGRYVALGTILQDIGALLGLYAFTRLTARTGRRPAFALAYAAGLAATVLTFGWLRQPGDIFWMMPLLGFCNLMVFGGFSIYFPELYPTRLRSTGVGFCYNAGRIVAALGPFTLGGLTVALTDLGFAAPFRAAAIALASVYLAGILALPFAPETHGRPLPEE